MLLALVLVLVLFLVLVLVRFVLLSGGLCGARGPGLGPEAAEGGTDREPLQEPDSADQVHPERKLVRRRGVLTAAGPEHETSLFQSP